MRMRDVIVCMIFLVLAVAAGLTAFNEWGEADQPDYEYLDMVPLSTFGDPDAVSGCCEVVTYLGEPYVRMTDVGEIQVVKGSKAKTYVVGPARLDLFLLTGQSNSMVYTNPGFWPVGDTVVPQHEAGASPLRPGTAFYLGTAEGPEDDVRYGGVANADTIDVSQVMDMTAPDGSIRLAQTYPVFMYDWIEMTGHRVIVINSGLGGRSINAFMEGGECHVWTEEVVHRALEVMDPGHFRIEPVAVLWSQGEANASMPVQEYKSKLETLIGFFADGTFGIAFNEVYTSIPRHPTVASPTNPDIAQRLVAEEDGRFVIATDIAPSLPAGLPYFRDAYHYTQKVYNWMGEAFARAAASAHGFAAIPETLVFCPDPTVGETSLTVLGTSGKAYTATAEWTGSVAVLTQTPLGTIPEPGLTIEVGTGSEED